MIRLKEIRERAKVTQPELANYLGVTTRSIVYWESGLREPRFDVVVKIADYFNVSLDCLFDRVPNVDKYTINEEAIIAEFQRLTIEQQRQVIDYAKFIQKK